MFLYSRPPWEFTGSRKPEVIYWSKVKERALITFKAILSLSVSCLQIYYCYQPSFDTYLNTFKGKRVRTVENERERGLFCSSETRTWWYWQRGEGADCCRDPDSLTLLNLACSLTGGNSSVQHPLPALTKNSSRTQRKEAFCFCSERNSICSALSNILSKYDLGVHDLGRCWGNGTLIPSLRCHNLIIVSLPF